MNIGRLDRLVNIQSVSYAGDAYGDSQTPTWTNYATDVPARLDYPGTSGSDDTFEANQEVNVSTVIFTVRYDSGILDTMRLVYDSKNYKIVRMQEIGRQEGFKLTTENRDNE